MPRIVSGSARGRRLEVPAGRGTRPTSDRAREGLFSALESMLRTLRGRRVADLYAGSGAVGVEALSRGAAAVLLVDDDPRALRAIRANVAVVGRPGAVVSPLPVETLASGRCDGPGYDVVFLDPPYAVADAVVADVLVSLAGNGWLAADAVVVVERSSRGGPFRWPAGLSADRDRAYGEATLWYGRAAGPQDADARGTSPV